MGKPPRLLLPHHLLRILVDLRRQLRHLHRHHEELWIEYIIEGRDGGLSRRQTWQASTSQAVCNKSPDRTRNKLGPQKADTRP